MVEGEFVQMEKTGADGGRSRILRPDLPQDGLPVRRLHAPGRGPGPEPRKRPRSRWGNTAANLGIAFQIVDDVLDLTATEQVLGKPSRQRFARGQGPPLAIVHCAGAAEPPHEHEAIRRVLEDLSFERTSHQEVLKILDRHGSVQYALDSAFQYAEVARAALCRDCLSPTTKRALLWMPDFVVARDK